jgi:hypothetical protein
MNPWISAAVGALPGYVVLAATVLWVRELCLPVSAHEVKWQCEVSFWAIATAYFAASFLAAFLAARRKAAAGLAAFAALLLGHAFVPDLSLISFGKRWYLDEHTLLFAVIPAMIGGAAAMLAAGRWRLMRSDHHG